MLVIRNDQLLVLSEYMRGSFIDRMAIHLRQAFPEKTANISEADLKKQIDQGIVAAERFSVMKEEDIEKYLECEMRFGKNFPENPATAWAGSILRPNEVDGTRKMRRIMNRIQKMDEGIL